MMAITLPYSVEVGISQKTIDTYKYQNYFSDTQSGERVMMLDGSLDSFYHRLHLIEKAEEKIDFAMYTTHPGDATDLFFAALLAAADRGVKVNILIDNKFCNLNTKTKYALKSHENVFYAEFNVINIFKPQESNWVLHDKFMVFDDKYMIFGGRNIGDKYFFEPHEYHGKRSLDRDVLVYDKEKLQGGGIDQVNQYFISLKESKYTTQMTTNSKASIKAGAKKKDELVKKLSLYKATHYADWDERWTEEKYEEAGTLVNKITLVVNGLGNIKKEPIISYALYDIAKHSNEIIAHSPYFTYQNKRLEKYKQLVDEGKNIVVLTNSLASTANVFACGNYYVSKDTILKTGVTLYECQLPDNQHTKTYVFDDRLTVFGSYNLDERSYAVDNESVLIIDSEDFNIITRDTLQYYFKNSLKVKSKREYSDTHEFLQEGEQLVEPAKLPWIKEFVFSAVGYFVYLIKYMV
jgi:putative cardiolipin synthase